MLTLLAAFSAAASLLACVLVFGMKGKLGADEETPELRKRCAR